ncbi:SycD/LcrH family type III secretion system chaperone [Bordetella sp. H567]|uniref:SycD/LcrH family type III secretion system chaperone n=1 Tax=Bordetella sp. H567 TaxID=1697043 RepID=UPI0008317B45|nr:SycD/LcrH family type III secretion system chaperone [Bordetella sp. H567]
MPMPYRGQDLGADIRARVRKILRDGAPLGDSLRIPAQDRKVLYAVAYKLYAEARYDLAQHLFAQLVMYDHHQVRYMKGLAAATQMLGDHEEAMRMYSVAALMDASDPAVVMHAGDCFRAMGKHARAVESFDLARAMCSKAEHEPVKRRCNQLLAELRRAA